jgi:hypothetical protein
MFALAFCSCLYPNAKWTFRAPVPIPKPAHSCISLRFDFPIKKRKKSIYTKSLPPTFGLLLPHEPGSVDWVGDYMRKLVWILLRQFVVEFIEFWYCFDPLFPVKLTPLHQLLPLRGHFLAVVAAFPTLFVLKVHQPPLPMQLEIKWWKAELNQYKGGANKISI